jgi:hypothetical protein
MSNPSIGHANDGDNDYDNIVNDSLLGVWTVLSSGVLHNFYIGLPITVYCFCFEMFLCLPALHVIQISFMYVEASRFAYRDK